MSIRIIRTGKDPVLRQVAKPVPKVTKAIEKVLDDMAETMYDAEGIGLAAVQIGIVKRLVVVDVGDGLVDLINPEIVEASGSQIGYEGCLSLPGLRGEVDRAVNIKVRAWNRKEEVIEFEATELFARAIQHEVDHLNGILFTDYLKPSDVVYEDTQERK
ncbi:peptide deformylase [Alicyclobacillus mengziensis]|uniref:Peptide deformylase n=1 Tax=Alicyclobacillus mengziensis TaxID=2931921 RepID=A0A9X7Z9C5_9BACL|nr:peptide deformylase [Alicyclobacillus mengziensis]QSO49503.1 peptide deformylase [Alicyclobacillus mengziensis]